MPIYTSRLPGALSLPVNTLSILCVSHKMYLKAAPVFYGLYTFRSTSVESFGALFLNEIGLFNTRSNPQVVDWAYPLLSRQCRVNISVTLNFVRRRWHNFQS